MRLPALADASAMITVLAELNEQLIEHATTLRARPEVASVSRGMDARNYKSGTILELYVDAELRNGRTLTWWVDVRSDGDALSVSAAVDGIRASEQVVVLSFPTEIASSTDELTGILRSTGQRIRKSIDLVASEQT